VLIATRGFLFQGGRHGSIAIDAKSEIDQMAGGESRFQVPGIRYQVSGIRYQVSGIRYQVSGIRYQVSGIRYQVSGIRYQVSGDRSFARRAILGTWNLELGT